MGIQQLAVLSATLRLENEFTTADVVREAGVSPDVVRKTFQRYAHCFRVLRADNLPASGGTANIRSLTELGRKEIADAAAEARQALPVRPQPPDRSKGPGGEPAGLLGAEQVLYELVTASGPRGRSTLLDEVRSLLDFGASEIRRSPDQVNAARLAASLQVYRVIGSLHLAAEKLVSRLEQPLAGEVRELAESVLSPRASGQAGGKRGRLASVPGISRLVAARTKAAAEADEVARLLLEVGSQAGWCAAVGKPDGIWTASESQFLQAQFGAAPEPRAPDALAIARKISSTRPQGKRAVFTGAVAAFLSSAFENRVAADSHIPPRWLEGPSARSIADWLVSSWWRVRWEPPSWGRPGAAWLSAHSVPVPRLRAGTHALASQGDYICLLDATHPIGSLGPRVLLMRCATGQQFEEGAEAFITNVLTEAGGAGATVGLKSLSTRWEELDAERRDPVRSAYRKIEAVLGYGPGRSPGGLVDTLSSRSLGGFDDGGMELAAACAGPKALTWARRTVSCWAEIKGFSGRVAPIPLRVPSMDGSPDGPWDAGIRLAREFRTGYGLGEGPLDDPTVAGLIGLTRLQLLEEFAHPDREFPFSMALRELGSGKISMLFSSDQRHSRRFDAARLLAAALFSNDQQLLVASEARTAVQTAQRAFATEVLAPIAELRGFMSGGDLSPEAAERAAQKFGISSIAIQNHLDASST